MQRVDADPRPLSPPPPRLSITRFNAHIIHNDAKTSSTERHKTYKALHIHSFASVAASISHPEPSRSACWIDAFRMQLHSNVIFAFLLYDVFNDSTCFTFRRLFLKVRHFSGILNNRNCLCRTTQSYAFIVHNRFSFKIYKSTMQQDRALPRDNRRDASIHLFERFERVRRISRPRIAFFFFF